MLRGSYSLAPGGDASHGGFGRNMVESLVHARGAPRTFSLCLSEEVGALVLGGTLPPDALGARSDRFGWISTGRGSFTVELADIKFEGSSIGVPRTAYRRTIVDSGTTFIYMPPSAYRIVRDRWRSSCPPRLARIILSFC